MQARASGAIGRGVFVIIQRSLEILPSALFQTDMKLRRGVFYERSRSTKTKPTSVNPIER